MNNKGFTLLDFVVGLSIFSLVIIIVSSTISTITRESISNNHLFLEDMNFINTKNAIIKDLSENMIVNINLNNKNSELNINKAKYIIKNGNLYRNNLQITKNSLVKIYKDNNFIYIDINDKNTNNENQVFINLDDKLINFKVGDSND